MPAAARALRADLPRGRPLLGALDRDHPEVWVGTGTSDTCRARHHSLWQRECQSVRVCGRCKAQADDDCVAW